MDSWIGLDIASLFDLGTAATTALSELTHVF